MPKFYAEKDYQKIANLYSLGPVEKINYVHKGFQTPKIAATTKKGKFVISRHRLSKRKDITNKSLDSLQYEIDLLNILKSLTVPHYVLSKNKKYIERFRDDWVTVDLFIDGSVPARINTKKAYELGLFLGKFHKLGVRFRKRMLGRRRFYDLRLAIMQKMKAFVSKQKNLALRAVIKEIETGVKSNRPPRNLSEGPIHVDIKPENELFIGDKLKGIVDFGNFYIGPYMIDIGKTIMWNCCNDGKLDPKLLKAFLKGYNNERKLKKSEQKYLRKSILYAIYSHIWVDLYHVPLKYVPEKYTLFLVNNFLPVAKNLEKQFFPPV